MLPRSLLQPRLLLQVPCLRTVPSRNHALACALRQRCAVPLPCHPISPCSVYRNFSSSRTRRKDATDTKPTDSSSPSTETSKTTTVENNVQNEDVYSKVYLGPLDSTFRRLKLFSLTSLALSATLAPFMFVIESNLPMAARLSLASIALTTSGVSTALVSWCGKPYVTQLRYINPEENGGAEGMEMTTMTLTLKPRTTRVYDPSFLVETRRAFAKWELAEKVVISTSEDGSRQVTPGQEETVAETVDKDGKPVGRWVVTWGEDGEGTCRELGNVVRYFNVHEELLP